jgi:hypothetical protein
MSRATCSPLPAEVWEHIFGFLLEIWRKEHQETYCHAMRDLLAVTATIRWLLPATECEGFAREELVYFSVTHWGWTLESCKSTLHSLSEDHADYEPFCVKPTRNGVQVGSTSNYRVRDALPRHWTNKAKDHNYY